MKILAIGDIHMNVDAIAGIDLAPFADLVLINGDLTNYGSIPEAKQVLEKIMEVNPNVLAQFGNLDKPEVNDYLEDLGINMHNQARLLNNRVCLIGTGGSNRTPFNTPSEFTEQQLESFLKNSHEQATRYLQLAEPIEKFKIPLILVTHTPPLDTTTDLLSNSSHAGSAAVRKFIEEQQPDLCIAGHIHEARGYDQLGKTPVYNPGMFRDGGWLEIDINRSEIKTVLHDR